MRRKAQKICSLFYTCYSNTEEKNTIHHHINYLRIHFILILDFLVFHLTFCSLPNFHLDYCHWESQIEDWQKPILEDRKLPPWYILGPNVDHLVSL